MRRLRAAVPGGFDQLRHHRRQGGRSSAVGLYASIFYIGGSVGAFLTGFAWNAAGWTGCVAMILAMQLIVAAIVSFAWER